MKTNSDFIKYFLYKISTLKGQLFAVSLFGLLSYPLFCSLVAAFEHAREALEPYENWGDKYGVSVSVPQEYWVLYEKYAELRDTVGFVFIICMISLFMLFLTGYFIVRSNFRYLHNKNFVDNDISLPVSFNTKFFGDFLSGLTVYIVPHILCALLGSLIIGDMNIEFDMWQSFQDMIRTYMTVGVLMCFIFYCTTVLVFSVCGRSRKTVSMTALYNIAVPVTVFSAFLLYCYSGYGININSSSGVYLFLEIPDILTSLSPLGLLVSSVISGAYQAYSVLSPSRIISIIIVCAAATAGAYFLCKNRRHERTGQAFVFSPVRHIASGLAVLAVTLAVGLSIAANMPRNDAQELVTSFPQYDIPYELIAAIWFLSAFGFFIAIEMTSGAKRKKLPALLLKYLAYAGGSFAAAFILAGLHAPIIAEYVPSASDISSAKIDIDLLDYAEFPIDDPEPFLQLQKEIISAKPKDYGCGTTVDLDISYVLNDGKRIGRSYPLTTEYLKKTYELLYSSGAVRNCYTLNVYAPDDRGQDKVTLFCHSTLPHSAGNRLDIPTDKLQEALWKDSEKMTYEQMLRKPCVTSWNFTATGSSEQRFTVYAFFDNTLELLEAYGMKPDIELDMTEAYIVKAENTGALYLTEEWLPVPTYYDDEISGLYAYTDDPEAIKELISMSSVRTAYEYNDTAYYLVIKKLIRDHSGYSNNVYTYRNVIYLPVTQENAARAAEIFNSSQKVSGNRFAEFEQSSDNFYVSYDYDSYVYTLDGIF